MPLHKNNKHKKGYDFISLCKENPELTPHVFVNKFDTQTIDFSKAKAVKALNTALLKNHYNIKFWKFPDTNLCPPIPGRVEYLHRLTNILKPLKSDTKNILDIGTGASCIYPILGVQEFQWQFVATDIDEKSIDNAKYIIHKNQLEDKITVRHQPQETAILENIMLPTDKFDAAICNPPFFNSQEDAKKATERKLKGLEKQKGFTRNFSGITTELSYKGGEKAFLHNYLYQSSLYKTQCFWFTSLVSKKENIKPMKASLEKLGATEIKVVNMEQGNKVTRFIAWTFLSKKEQENW